MDEVTPLNIIIFGTSQQGKSSLILNICKYLDIKISNDIKVGGDMTGCTFTYVKQEIKINNKIINLYDTCGLNESEDGTVTAYESFYNLKNLLKSLNNGICLMIYVKKKSAFTTIDDNNINLFQILCGRKVPLWLLINDADIDNGLDYNENSFDVFYEQIKETWDNYTRENIDNIQTNNRSFIKVLCGYNERTGILQKSNFGKMLKKASCKLILHEIRLNAIKNIKIYNDINGLFQMLISICNFFIQIFYKIKENFSPDFSDNENMINKLYISKNMYNLFIKLGFKHEDAVKEAQRYADLINEEIYDMNI